MSVPQPREILNDARILLDNMAEDTEIIRDELLTPAEQAALHTTLSQLAVQATSLSSDSDLLALARAIVSEVEALPALRHEFVGDVDPTSQNEARALSQEVFEKSGGSLTKDDGERISIANELKTNIKAIAEAMLPEENESDGNADGNQNAARNSERI